MTDQITIVGSWSEVDTYRQCAFKHELGYKERWKAPELSAPLAKGIGWHEIMEVHYDLKRLVDKGTIERGDPSMERYVNEVLAVAGCDSGEYADLWRWMFEGHLEYWGSDECWRILGVEVATTQLLPGQDPDAPVLYALKTKIDLVVREMDTKKIRVVDHKSGKNLPKSKELDLLDQFVLYSWILRQQGHKVFGQLYNAARADKLQREMTLDERFERQRLYTTDFELEACAIDAMRTLRRAYAAEIGEAERSTNPDTCRWKCDFTEPCLFGRKRGDEVTRLYLTDKGYTQDFTRH